MAGGAQEQLLQSLHCGGEGKIQLPVLEKGPIWLRKKGCRDKGREEGNEGGLIWKPHCGFNSTTIEANGFAPLICKGLEDSCEADSFLIA